MAMLASKTKAIGETLTSTNRRTERRRGEAPPLSTCYPVDYLPIWFRM